MLSVAIQEKLSDSLIHRKEEVALDFGQEVTNEEKDYDAFFTAAMKKFGISSPADLKTDEKKKEFFNYIDKNFKAKNEDLDVDEIEENEEVDEDIERRRQHLGMFDASGRPRMSRHERLALRRAKAEIKNQDKRKHGYVPKASAMKKEEHEEVDEDIERRRQHLGMFDASGNPRLSRQERAAIKREKLAIKNQDKRKHGYVPKASATKKP